MNLTCSSGSEKSPPAVFVAKFAAVPPAQTASKVFSRSNRFSSRENPQQLNWPRYQHGLPEPRNRARCSNAGLSFRFRHSFDLACPPAAGDCVRSADPAKAGRPIRILLSTQPWRFT